MYQKILSAEFAILKDIKDHMALTERVGDYFEKLAESNSKDILATLEAVRKEVEDKEVEDVVMQEYMFAELFSRLPFEKQLSLFQNSSADLLQTLLRTISKDDILNMFQYMLEYVVPRCKRKNELDELLTRFSEVDKQLLALFFKQDEVYKRKSLLVEYAKEYKNKNNLSDDVEGIEDAVKILLLR